MKIEIGTPVTSKKNGNGTITKIITKSTGYVEVTFENGSVKKEMAFNLTSNGEVVKNKPAVRYHTEASAARQNRQYAQFQKDMRFAVLSDEYLPQEVNRLMSK